MWKKSINIGGEEITEDVFNIFLWPVSYKKWITKTLNDSKKKMYNSINRIIIFCFLIHNFSNWWI